MSASTSGGSLEKFQTEWKMITCEFTKVALQTEVGTSNDSSS